MTNNEKRRLCMGCMSLLDGEAEKCPHCGYMRGSQTFSREYLPPRTELAERYLVGNLVMQNGEGALYIGYDLEEERKLLIGEYFPRTLCSRNESDGRVLPRYGREAQYKALMYDYLEIAQLLQKLTESGSSGLVPVLDLLEAGGTVYVVYRYIQAVPLSTYLLENGGELSWSQAKPMLMPLLKSLSAVHKAGAVHGGISPDTILVDAKGQLWLRGFSVPALRTAESELNCELFEGYAAPEQYAASGWQGTWTDVYGVAAVIYRILTGTMPVSGDLRREKDTLYPANLLNSSVPPAISEALDAAMTVSVEKRIQSVDQLIARLLETAASNTTIFDSKKAGTHTESGSSGSRNPFSKLPFPFRVMILTMIPLLAVMLLLYFLVVEPALNPSSSSEPASLSESSSASEPSSEQDSTPQDVGVPDFTGQFADRVVNNGEYTQKYEFILKEEYNDETPSGVVYDQSPKKGTPMLNKGSIILYVSKGSQKTKMPYLIGSTLELAARTLDSMNIYYDVVIEEDENAVDPPLINRTSLEPGSEVLKEQDVVYLYIAQKPEHSSEEDEED